MSSARQKGGVLLPSGRLLQMEPMEYYKAFNWLIQGTAADIVKQAMVDCHAILQGKKSSLLLQVHDELIFEVWRSEWKNLFPRLVKAMLVEGPWELEVEASEWQGNWSKMKSISQIGSDIGKRGKRR